MLELLEEKYYQNAIIHFQFHLLAFPKIFLLSLKPALNLIYYYFINPSLISILLVI